MSDGIMDYFCFDCDSYAFLGMTRSVNHRLNREVIDRDFHHNAIEHVPVDVNQQDSLFDLLREDSYYSMDRDRKIMKDV